MADEDLISDQNPGFFTSILNYLNSQPRTQTTIDRLTHNVTGIAGKPGQPTTLQSLGQGVLTALGGLGPVRGPLPSVIGSHPFYSAPGVAEMSTMNPGRIPGQSGFGIYNSNFRPGNMSRFDVNRAMSGYTPRGPTNRVTADQVINWLNQSGVQNRVETRGEHNTQYVIARDAAGNNVTVRIPEDRHIGRSRTGVGNRFDTGDILANENHTENQRFTRNASGESYSNPEVLFDALTHRLGTSPQGFRLISPDRAPQYPIAPQLGEQYVRAPQGQEQLEFLSRLGARPMSLPKGGSGSGRKPTGTNVTNLNENEFEVPGAPYSWSRPGDNYIAPLGDVRQQILDRLNKPIPPEIAEVIANDYANIPRPASRTNRINIRKKNQEAIESSPALQEYVNRLMGRRKRKIKE